MSSNLSFGTKIVVSLLQWRMGKVRAVERALRLQGVIRFLLLTIGFIIFPAILLAYFGMTSITEQEEDAISELQDISQNIALSFLQDINADIVDFENNVQQVLENNSSPLRNFHKHQRISLSFDKNLQMIAPFVENNETRGEDVLFHPAYRDSKKMYIDMDERTRDNILYDRYVSLMEKKKTADAKLLLKKLLQSSQRHIAGVKIKHLALVEQFYTSLPTKFEDFRIMMELILSEPWKIGEGIDGVFAKNVVVEYAQKHENLKLEEKTYIDNTLSRIDEKLQNLYWVSRWENEWRDIVAQQRQGQPGKLLWEMGNEAIWARTNWNGDVYIFGIEKSKVIEQLRFMAESESKRNMMVSMRLLEPQAKTPANVITRRYIPWLEGWSIAILEEDLSPLQEKADMRRTQKLSFIGFAVFVMIFGVVLASRVAMTELQNANIKSNFAASVSHELRSPITQIRLKGESLMFGLVEEQELEEHYESIVRESERLTWLVDNVLDYAAMERDNRAFTFREHNLQEVVQRVIDSMQVTLTMRDVEIEVEFVEEILWVKIDANAIAQCVTNLLSNAEKYSDTKWMGIFIRKNPNFIDIMVSDKGIGITEDDCTLIFEPFFRSKEQQALRRKGTGIGLAITKTIMLAHGGDVLVQSQLGHGSTFTLRFPIDIMIHPEQI